MKVIVTAGGTGGHIYPALAIIDEIKKQEPDSEILYIGTHNRMEKDIVPARGIEYVPLEIYGLTKNIFKNFRNLRLLLKAKKECIKTIKAFQPDVVIGVGGYVTYPVISAAHKLHIKTFIHEQNSIPGKSNRWLAKRVDKIGVSFKDSLKYFDIKKVFISGNPCSSSSINAKLIKKSSLGLDRKKKTIIICYGSLGSSAMIDETVDYLKSIANEPYQVLYITGKNYFDRVNKNKFPDNVVITPYVDGLPGLMKDCDLLVARAGASTIAEVSAIGMPTLFIPSAHVANNHQYYNALSVVDANAGAMIEEKDFTSKKLKHELNSLIKDEKRLKKYKTNLRLLSKDNSAELIYKEIKKMIKG